MFVFLGFFGRLFSFPDALWCDSDLFADLREGIGFACGGLQRQESEGEMAEFWEIWLVFLWGFVGSCSFPPNPSVFFFLGHLVANRWGLEDFRTNLS